MLSTIGTKHGAYDCDCDRCPMNFRQLQVADDDHMLTELFNNSERLSLMRTVLQVAAFGAMILGLYTGLGHRRSLKCSSELVPY
jgi:hypothetical protein